MLWTFTYHSAYLVPPESSPQSSETQTLTKTWITFERVELSSCAFRQSKEETFGFANIKVIRVLGCKRRLKAPFEKQLFLPAPSVWAETQCFMNIRVTFERNEIESCGLRHLKENWIIYDINELFLIRGGARRGGLIMKNILFYFLASTIAMYFFWLNCIGYNVYIGQIF